MTASLFTSVATALIALASASTPGPAEPARNRIVIPVATATPTAPRRRVVVPDPPTGLTLAGPADCSLPAVRAAVGGTDEACRARLNDGAVVMRWNPYHEADCANPADCFVGGYRLYPYRGNAPEAIIAGQERTAAVVAGAKLGDCFVVRAFRNPHESRNSGARCVTVIHTTQRLVLGPTEIGQFQAMVHDNNDHDYCTRRSWDSGWVASEPWGFTVHTQTLKPDPNAGGAGLRLTIGRLAVEHPGTKPFACEESLLHVWRGYLHFTVPTEARQANASIVFAFTPLGNAQARAQCFGYLWRPRHWAYRRPEGGASGTIGSNDGLLLDAADAIGEMSLGPSRASFDISNDPAVRMTGAIGMALVARGDGLDTNDVAHADLHRGKYLAAGGSTTCGVNDPHLEVSYVRTQSIPAPLLPPEPEQYYQLPQKTPEPQIPNFSRTRATPTPSPH